MKRTLILTGEVARKAACRDVLAAPIGWVAIVGPESRTQAQNRLLHPLLTDISKQAIWMGKEMSMLQWKTLMVSGHAVATGNAVEMTVGLEGEVVNLRESTAAMGKRRFASLVEYVLAWGAMNGVKFSDRQAA